MSSIVVPKELTDAMYNAGMNYLVKRGTAWSINDLYKVMIAAAPVIHASDCALHNEPAYPNGPCDCGAIK